MNLKTHLLGLGSLALLTTLCPLTYAENSSTTLDEVTVIGNLDEARNHIVPSLGASEYTLSSEQIGKQAQGAEASFNQVLLQAPGVAQDSYGQLHLRGEHANLQYRINDVLLPEGISGFGQELDTRFIDSVSLITGSLPAQYGFRTAGVVDIHTKSGVFAKGGSVSTYAGSFNTVKPSFEYGGSKGKLNYYVTGSFLLGQMGIENPTDQYQAIHNETRQGKGFGYLSYVIDETSRLNLMLSSSVSRFHIPNTPGLDTAFTLTGVPTFDSALLNERQSEQNYYAILAYQKSAGNLDLQASIFSRFSRVAFNPDPVGDLLFNGVASRVDRNSFSNGAEIDASYKINDKHTLRAGGLFTGTLAKNNSDTSVFSVDDTGAQSSSDAFSIQDNSRKIGYLYGFYAQDEWKIAKPLTLNFGARFDGSHTYVDEYQISPRVNLTYKPTEKTAIHTGYARYFTPPPLELINTDSINNFNGTTNASEVTVSSPVKSERAHYFDVGVNQQILPGLQMGLDGYYKIAKNQLDEGQFGQALIFSPFNYQRGRIYGIEFNSTFQKGGFSAYGNLAYSKALGKEITSGEFLLGQDEIDYIHDHNIFLDHDQRYTASLGASYNFKDTLVYANLLVGSGLRNGFANTEKLPAYSPVNIGIQHTVKVNRGGIQSLQARFDIVNLLDQTYELRDGSGIGVGAAQFGARRGFFGGLTLAFGNPPESKHDTDKK